MNLILLLFCHITVATAIANKQNLKNYVYNKEADAFYKVHKKEYSFAKAEDICSKECAELLTVGGIINEDEDQAVLMLKEYPDIHYIWAKSFIYRDSELVLNTYGEEQNSLETDELPFICKRKGWVCYNEACNIEADFTYSYETGSCYLLSNVSVTWDEANKLCQLKKSHLVVINSKAESLVVSHLMILTPVTSSYNNHFSIAGFRAGENREFLTVLNQTLEEAGFSQWGDGEPNNNDESEYCGSLSKMGTLNDVDCNKPYAFVCEKEIDFLIPDPTPKAMFNESSNGARSSHINLFIVLIDCILSFLGGICIHLISSTTNC